MSERLRDALRRFWELQRVSRRFRVISEGCRAVRKYSFHGILGKFQKRYGKFQGLQGFQVSRSFRAILKTLQSVSNGFKDVVSGRFKGFKRRF